MPPKVTQPAQSLANPDKRGLAQSIHNPHNDVPVRGPRPEHFIIRKGRAQDILVPLIPLDLLPDYVDLVGVRRELALADTVGMSNLGEFTKPQGHFQLHFVSPSDREDAVQSTPPAAPTASARNVPAPLPPTLARTPPPVMPPPPPPRRVIDWAEDTESVSTDDFSGAEFSSGSSSNNNKYSAAKAGVTSKTKDKSTARAADRMLEVAAAASAHHLAPSRPASAPTPSNTAAKKVPRIAKPKVVRPPGSLCRHWCQTGQCSWGTECRYTHQMPVTLEGLSDVGLTELPAWWRKAAGLPGQGTIDVRIFSGAPSSSIAAAMAGCNSGGKNSPGQASSAGPTSMMVANQSNKKTKLRADRDARTAEEMYQARLGIEKVRAAAAAAAAESPVPVLGEAARRKLVSQMQQQYPGIEKLVDI